MCVLKDGRKRNSSLYNVLSNVFFHTKKILRKAEVLFILSFENNRINENAIMEMS